MRKIGLQFLLILPLTTFGQSISYLENTVLYSNPAARINGKFLSTNSFNFDYTLQNRKLTNPRLTVFSYSKIDFKNFQFGIGTNSFIGEYFRSSTLKLDANYSFQLSDNLNLAVGLGANINQYGFYNTTSSPGFSPSVSSRFVGLKGGLMLQGKQFRTGLTVNNFNEPKFTIFNDTLIAKYSLGFYADYRFRINENWSLTPQINIAANNQLNTFLGISAYYKKLQFGTSIIGHGFSFFAGYTFNDKFMVSVISKFDRPLLNNGKLNQNTMLNFSFQVPKIKKEKSEKL